MSQTLEQWMKFFYITGTSVKVYFDKSLLFILSVASICFYVIAIVAAVVFFDYDGISKTNKNVKLLLILSALAVCFGVCLAIFTVILKAKVEQKFWETVSEVEDTFERLLGEFFLCGRFNKIFGLKFIVVISYILAEFPVIFSLFLNENGKALASVLILVIFKTILRIFLIKYTFYVDVLHVCLKNIEAKMQKRGQMRLRDLRILKKAYNLCWQLSSMIEDIFGWGMVYIIVLRLCSSVFESHNLYKEIAKGRINLVGIVPLLMNITEIFIPATTCQKCVETTNSIVHCAFSINSPAFHGEVEDFIRQTTHERIKFEPKTFFVVNHGLIVGVSIDLINCFDKNFTKLIALDNCNDCLL
jgi:uncharacterized protein YacL